MKTTTQPTTRNIEAPAPELQEVPGPPPLHRRGRRPPPLEDRTDWDPWLPPRHAYPDVPGPLRAMALILLLILAYLGLILMLSLFAP